MPIKVPNLNIKMDDELYFIHHISYIKTRFKRVWGLY